MQNELGTLVSEVAGQKDLLALFRRVTSDRGLLRAVQRAAPEYGRAEFLLPVDATGVPLRPEAPVLADVRAALAGERTAPEAAPGEAAGWFRLDVWNGEPVVLVARWLCHLTGTRHRTVELFIDHPAEPGVTLVQVRSLSKVEAPGGFDMPVAGHVTGVDSPDTALRHELAEELGLDLTDLVDLRRFASYESTARGIPGLLWHNREWCTVYRSRLAPGAWSRVRFADGEVAALALFGVGELRALAAAYPDRLATGLTMSLPLLTDDGPAG